jgi:5-formyltetrahydrofolate cyclo-ligase
MAKATATPKVKEKKKLTRARAEQLIARTSDLGELKDERFTKHANKHVKKKAEHKIAKLLAQVPLEINTQGAPDPLSA